MHKQVSGWTVNFCPNFPESPFLEFQTRKPRPPFGKLQIWDDQSLLRNTPLLSGNVGDRMWRLICNPQGYHSFCKRHPKSKTEISVAPRKEVWKNSWITFIFFLVFLATLLLLRDWCKENVIFMLIGWHHNDIILHSDEPSRSVLHSLSEMINDNSKYKRNDFGITIIVIIGKWNHESRNMGQSSILLSRNCHVAEICSNGDSQLVVLETLINKYLFLQKRRKCII